MDAYDPQTRIIEVAKEQGVPVEVALAIAKQESSFKIDAYPKDRNGKPLSSAYGLFQFTNAAWADYKIKPKSKKRLDPEVQISTGIDRIKKSMTKMRDVLGREPSNSELYMSHLFGPTGGPIVAASNPKESILKTLTRAYGGTKGAKRALNSNPWIRQNGISSAGQLHDFLNKKVAKRVAEVEPIIQAHAGGQLAGQNVRETKSKKSNDVNLIGYTQDTEGNVVETGKDPVLQENESDEDQLFDEGVVESLPQPTTPFYRDQEGNVEEVETSIKEFPDRPVSPPKYQQPGRVSAQDYIKNGETQGNLPKVEVPKEEFKNAPELRDSQPSRVVTLAEEKAIKKQIEEDTPGLWEGVKKSVELDHILSWALDGHDDFKPDLNFTVNEDWLKENASHIPSQYWDEITYAWSDSHAKRLVERVQKNIDLERDLGRLGWTGTGIRIATSIVDPVAIGAIALTGGGGYQLIMRSKLSRLQKLLSTSALAGVESAALESLLVSQKPLGSYQDIAYAFWGGAALGGLFNARAVLKSGDLDPDAIKLNEIAEKAKKDIEDVELGVIDPKRSSVGAAQVNSGRIDPINETASQALFDARDAPETAFSSVRRDSVGQLKSSKNPLVRDLGDKLGQDTVGNKDHSPVTSAASEFQDHIMQRMDSRFQKDVGFEYRKWAKANNVKFYEHSKKRAEFMDKVTAKMRDTKGLIEADEYVTAAANKNADLYEWFLSLAQDPGYFDGKVVKPVRGFDDIEFNRNYVPRIHNQAAWHRNLERFGDNKVERFFTEAMGGLRPDVPTNQLHKFAQVYVRAIKENTVDDHTVTRALSGEDTVKLREMLVDDGGLDESIFKQVVETLRTKDDKTGTHSRSKARALYNENFKALLTDANGNRVELAISDFFVNDAEKLFRIYNRQMSGAIALARSGFDSKAALQSELRKIRQAAHEVKGYSQSALEKDIENLEFLGTMILGTPVGEFGKRLFKARNSDWGKASKLIRDFNFIRIMNQVGFAQLGEMGNIIGNLGIKTAISNMPSMKALVRDARTGELRDDFSRELEAAFGIGTDRLRNTSHHRHDDFGNFIDPDEGQFLNKVDQYIEGGKRITADISGMTAINNYLQRWAVRVVSQKFADFSKNTSKHWNERRLSQAGLTLDDIAAIKSQIDTHAKTEKGVITKHRLTQLNLNAWDREVRGKFVTAVDRISKRIVQENDPGNMHRWMSLPLGQMIFQFRNFMLVAHAKQLLNGLHARDVQTGMSFLMSSVTAGMAYALQQNMLSIGRPNAQEYRDEKLSLEAIGRASFARAGWASLIPWGTDMFATSILQADPIFDVRASGLSTSGFGQNPTTQFVTDGVNTIGAIVGSSLWSDESFTEGDWNKATMTLVPFQNAMGIQQFLRNIGTAFPEED